MVRLEGLEGEDINLDTAPVDAGTVGERRCGHSKIGMLVRWEYIRRDGYSSPKLL